MVPRATAAAIHRPRASAGPKARADFRTPSMPEHQTSSCDQEPIHIPGAIQPHGAMLAARIGEWSVTHASANLGSILGRTPHSVLGRAVARCDR